MTVEEYNKIPFNEDILIKYGEGRYYVVNKINEGPDYYGRYTLTEANGEQYSEWDIEEIEDWMPCKELDKFFTQRKKKGHWIDTNALDAKYKVIYMCSNCRSFYTEMKPTNMNFCPNCGAKMESEK